MRHRQNLVFANHILTFFGDIHLTPNAVAPTYYKQFQDRETTINKQTGDLLPYPVISHKKLTLFIYKIASVEMIANNSIPLWIGTYL